MILRNRIASKAPVGTEVGGFDIARLFRDDVGTQHVFVSVDVVVIFSLAFVSPVEAESAVVLGIICPLEGVGVAVVLGVTLV